MFFEIIGRRALPGHVDRDDVEDAISEALGENGEVTGAGTGASGWSLDVETIDSETGLVTIAAALAGLGLGWVLVRREDWAQGRRADAIVT